jgi:hypothetical protein
MIAWTARPGRRVRLRYRQVVVARGFSRRNGRRRDSAPLGRVARLPMGTGPDGGFSRRRFQGASVRTTLGSSWRRCRPERLRRGRGGPRRGTSGYRPSTAPARGADWAGGGLRCRRVPAVPWRLRLRRGLAVDEAGLGVGEKCFGEAGLVGAGGTGGAASRGTSRPGPVNRHGSPRDQVVACPRAPKPSPARDSVDTLSA